MSYVVLIADDHPLYRDALRTVVGAAFSDVQCRESEDIATTLQALDSGEIDLVLLDLSMPDAVGLDGLLRLRRQHPAIPVIICSAHDDAQTVREAFRAGAAGYLPKSSGAALSRHALQIVRSGGSYVPSEALRETTGEAGAENSAAHGASTQEQLTPRQLHVLELMEKGLSNKAIGRELGIGEITVKAHVSAILRKLGVENRVQAVLAARDRQSSGGG